MDRGHSSGVLFGCYNIKAADGRKYVGAWENGKQHGTGQYTNQQGVVRFGEWYEGKRQKWLDEKDNSRKENELSNGNKQADT